MQLKIIFSDYSYCATTLYIKGTYLESDAQCMAYILARWPRSVRRVRICIRLSGSTFAVACNKVVSAAAFLASCNQLT
jgi:hypothetical protein